MSSKYKYYMRYVYIAQTRLANLQIKLIFFSAELFFVFQNLFLGTNR
jgi:hypothetical protein